MNVTTIGFSLGPSPLTGSGMDAGADAGAGAGAGFAALLGMNAGGGTNPAPPGVPGSLGTVAGMNIGAPPTNTSALTGATSDRPQVAMAQLLAAAGSTDESGSPQNPAKIPIAAAALPQPDGNGAAAPEGNGALASPKPPLADQPKPTIATPPAKPGTEEATAIVDMPAGTALAGKEMPELRRSGHEPGKADHSPSADTPNDTRPQHAEDEIADAGLPFATPVPVSVSVSTPAPMPMVALQTAPATPGSPASSEPANISGDTPRLPRIGSAAQRTATAGQGIGLPFQDNAGAGAAVTPGETPVGAHPAAHDDASGFHVALAVSENRAPAIAAAPGMPPLHAPGTPTMPNEPVVQARPGELGRTLGLEIARKLTAGEETLRVRLHPAELGRVEVMLAFDDKGSLQATMRTESSHALHLLQQDAPDLGRALDQAGIRTDPQSFRFESRTGGTGGSGGTGGGNGNGSQSSAQHQSHGRPQDFRDTPESPATAYRTLRGEGQIDLIA